MEHHSFLSTFIFTTINFIIYAIIIYKFLVPKVKEGLEQKLKKMQEELEKEKSNFEVARKKYEEAKEKRRAVEDEAKKIEEEFSHLAESEAERILKEAQEFEKKKMMEIENLINSKIEEAKAEIRNYALEYAVKIAEEQIKSKKTKEDYMRFLSKVIDYMERGRN